MMCTCALVYQNLWYLGLGNSAGILFRMFLPGSIIVVATILKPARTSTLNPNRTSLIMSALCTRSGSNWFHLNHLMRWFRIGLHWNVHGWTCVPHDNSQLMWSFLCLLKHAVSSYSIQLDKQWDSCTLAVWQMSKMTFLGTAFFQKDSQQSVRWGKT